MDNGTTPDPDEAVRGDSRVSIFLWDVDEPTINRLLDRFCDVLAEEGYANVLDDEEPMRSVLGVWPWDPPETDDNDAFFEEVFSGAALIAVPNDPADVGADDPDDGV